MILLNDILLDMSTDSTCYDHGIDTIIEERFMFYKLNQCIVNNISFTKQ